MPETKQRRQTREGGGLILLSAYLQSWARNNVFASRQLHRNISFVTRKNFVIILRTKTNLLMKL